MTWVVPWLAWTGCAALAALAIPSLRLRGWARPGALYGALGLAGVLLGVGLRALIGPGLATMAILLVLRWLVFTVPLGRGRGKGLIFVSPGDAALAGLLWSGGGMLLETAFPLGMNPSL